MTYYSRCPICQAYLDPGEKCDCTKREAALEAANNQSGRIEQVLTLNYSGAIIHDDKRECQEKYIRCAREKINEA